MADMTTTDLNYMRRALELAKRGVGHVSPNPMVGAVIVKDDRIIGVAVPADSISNSAD